MGKAIKRKLTDREIQELYKDKIKEVSQEDWDKLKEYSDKALKKLNNMFDSEGNLKSKYEGGN